MAKRMPVLWASMRKRGLAMAVAAVVGGYLGARVSRRLNRKVVRWFVIAMGLILAAQAFYKQWAETVSSGPGSGQL